MESLLDALRDPWVIAYLALLIAGNWAVLGLQALTERRRTMVRERAGLDESLAAPAARLAWFRRWNRLRLAVLLVTGVGFPVSVVAASRALGYEDSDNLLLAFVVVVVFVLWNATEVTRAWLGGVAFEAMVIGQRPFQVGDRVTLGGHVGEVTSIDPWYVKLQTPGDDLVSVPTYSLWAQVLSSANAGERASLVIIELRLAPEVDKQQRRRAEGFLLDAIYASPYLDPAKPVQLHVEQTGPAVVLRGKAYAGSTYHEFSMRSDVSKAFLDYAADEGIPLARRS